MTEDNPYFPYEKRTVVSSYYPCDVCGKKTDVMYRRPYVNAAGHNDASWICEECLKKTGRIPPHQLIERPDWVIYYLDIASAVARRSPCSRAKYGAIILVDNKIVGTGYNGTASGTINCGEKIPCLKDLYNEPHFSSYNYCPAIHAERNAILNRERSVKGGTLFLAPSLEFKERGARPCQDCRREIMQAGIEKCWYRNKDWNPIIEGVEEWKEMENNWMIDKLSNVPTKKVSQ